MTDEAFAVTQAQVIRDEDNRQFPYDDATGKTFQKGDTLQGFLTIGVGWNLSANGMPLKYRLSLLEDALKETIAALEQAHPVVLTLAPARQIALANMAYNVGVAALGGFHQMWAAIDRGSFETAAVEMLDSKWAEQVGPRATRLAEMMRSGEVK